MGGLQAVYRCWHAFAFCVVLVACGAPAPDPGVPPQSLGELIAAHGSVRVIVGVRTPFVPEGSLGVNERANQRGRIATAQIGARARLTGYSARHLHSFSMAPFMVMRVDDQETLDRLLADPQVSSVQEDRISPPLLDSTTPVIKAPQAWAAGYTGAGWAVAIIDSGVMNNHVNLSGKVISEACFSTTDAGNGSLSMCTGGADSSTLPNSGLNCPLSVTGCEHGTHVANIAAGANATLNGVARGANLIAIMAGSQFTAAGSCNGAPPCVRFYTSDWVRGLERVLALKQAGTQVASVNMSLGGGQYFDQSSCDLAEQVGKVAIDNLRSAGVPTVIASGNDGFSNSLAAPGCISSAISVGATTDGDSVIGFSNSATFLHVLAPGVNVTAAVPTTTTSTAEFSGTSMATPHVAGAIAVLRQAKPSLTVDQIISALETSGTPIVDSRNGLSKPRLDIFAAINFAQNEVAAPVFSPAGGTYPSAQVVTITTATPGAAIHYTIDGSAPTEASPLYTSAISVPATSTLTIKARAYKTGALESTAVTQIYDIGGTIATPTFSFPGGTYTFAVNLTITAPTPGSTLHLTTDGSTPTAASPLYTGAILIPQQTTRTIKVIAVHPGWTDSAIAGETYVITDTVEIPSFSLTPGTFTTPRSLAITTGTAGAQIRYTLDGSPATIASPLYTGPIALAAGTSTSVHARAFLSTWADSQEASGTFVITGTVATPAASPTGGTFSAPQLVALSTSTPGATIRFTTDGSPATASSPVYSTAISVPVASTMTIRARAFLATWGDSAELNETYDVTGTVATPVLSPAGGSFTAPQLVSISTSTVGAAIRFTVDGSPVTASAALYAGPIAVPAEAALTLRARAFKAGWADSAEASGTYSVVCTRSAPLVTLTPAAQTGGPGVLRGFDAAIKNTNDGGCLPATFAVTRSAPAGWTTALAASTATIASGQQTTVHLDVTPTSSATAADYPVSITASNAASGTATANATYTVTCTRAAPTLVLSPTMQSGQATNALDYTATLTNRDTGCAASTFTLASTVPAGWTGAYANASPSVASGASIASRLTVTSAAGAALGDHTFSADVTRAESAGASATGTYTVAPTCARAAPSLVLTPGTQTALRGSTVQYTASLTNHDSACGPSTFPLTLTLPAGWTGSGAPIVAGSGSTVTATIDITSAATANAGDFTITVGAGTVTSGNVTANATYAVQSTCVRQPPLISVTQPAAATSAVGLHYAVHVTSNDHVDCGSSTFTVSAAVPAGWTAPKVDQMLTPGVMKDFDLVVMPPASIGASSTTFDITVTNAGASNFSATANGLYVLGCEHVAPSLAVSTVIANENYAIKVINHDTTVCTSASFRVKLASTLAITPDQADVTAGPGMEGAFEVKIDPGTVEGDHDVRVTVTRIGDPAPLAEQTITVTVPKAPGGGDDGCQAVRAPTSATLLLLALTFVVRRRRRRAP